MAILALDDHEIYYELHGDEHARKAVCMGGWGTFCHGKTRDMPRHVVENFRVLIFDYPGLGHSTDNLATEPSTAAYARDLAALLDNLEWPSVDVVGMVGMGACVGQELAIARPDLVRTLVMTGTWAWADRVLSDMLKLFVNVHVHMGFAAFQTFVASFSFEGDFYNRNYDRLVGPEGAWGDLRGRSEAHARLVDACISHDVRGRISAVTVPALVLHAGLDPVTTPRHTKQLAELLPNCTSVEWPDAAHVLAGREMKKRFDTLLQDFFHDHPSPEQPDAGRDNAVASRGAVDA